MFPSISIASILKRACRVMGLRLTRTSVPFRSVSEALSELRSRSFHPKSIIDVGVAEGTPELYVSFPDAYLCLVEAVEEYREDIEKILTQRPGEYHPLAAGNYDGSGTLKIGTDPRKSSMHDRPPRKGQVAETREVPIKRLDSLALEHLAEPIILKIDVEGAEAAVLEGAERLLARVDAVLVETSIFAPQKAALGSAHGGGSSASDSQDRRSTLARVLEILECSGFSLIDIVGAADCFGGGPLAHADLLFMKATHPALSPVAPPA